MKSSSMILCQKETREYLSSGETGRNNLITTAKKCPSDYRSRRLLSLSEVSFSSFIKKGKWRHDSANSQDDATSSADLPVDSDMSGKSRRSSKRPAVSICIICGSLRIYTGGHSYDHKLFRISEKPRAQKLLNASDLFQDDVFP